MKNNNKKILIVGIITLLVMVGVIGGAFAFFIFANTTESQVLVAGDVFMKYTESDTVIDADMMMPRSSYDPKTYFEFTIEGKNTYSKDLYYEILINHGEDHETRTIRLEDKFLRFRLEEIVGEDVTPVIEEGTYEEIDNTKIWVNTIKANTKTKTSIKYRLYMWITDEVNISASGDYTNEVWNNDVFASIKVSVNGDFEEKKLENGEPAIDVIKEKVVAYADASKSDFDGGLVAINEEGNLYNETAGNETIREYRYSGLNVNNYIYYNCKDKDEEGHDLEQNSANCEVWRIIGVFKDEDGNEHLKIVRNNVLTRNMFPSTFKANNKTYKIQYADGGDYAHWNYISTSDNNNWATAGLQYWLNAGIDKDTKTPSDGYMSYLSENAKSMIEETKYYLGNIVFGKDTAVSAYTNERGSTTCSSSCNGGDVWKGNQAAWNGNIALMYPSDYGYTASSSNWSSQAISNYSSGARDTSWFYKTANYDGDVWLLSPSYYETYSVAYLAGGALASSWVGGRYFADRVIATYRRVQPCLYLKSDVRILEDTTGEETNPYQLTI